MKKKEKMERLKSIPENKEKIKSKRVSCVGKFNAKVPNLYLNRDIY